MADPRKTVVGNLTRDPQVGVDKNGKQYALLRLAENTRVQDEAGNWSDGPTEYHNVFVGGQLAEHVGQSLHKGDQAVVSGYEHEGRPYEKTDGTLAMGDPQIQATEVGAGLQYNAATVVHQTKEAEHRAPSVSADVGVEGPSPDPDPAQTTEWRTATPGQPSASVAMA